MRADPLIGSELAGYRVEELVGRGGMGVVYRAEHLLLGRKDAIKLLSPELAEDPSFRERFLRESRLAASIDHPNIVPIYHAGEMDGLLFIAMRYVEGTDLRTVLREKGKLDPFRTLSIVDQVASALDAAHGFNLVHRDVKPGNILLAKGERAYLTDFGIAKHTATHGGLTRTGSFVGTLDYAAPEQIEGKHLDGRADVYSLGCVVFQCLSGGPPYEKESEVQLIYAHLLEPPPAITTRLPDFPPGLDAVVTRALAKSRDDRYGSAGEFAAALRAELERSATVTRAASPPPAETPPAAAPPRPAPARTPSPPPAKAPELVPPAGSAAAQAPPAVPAAPPFEPGVPPPSAPEAPVSPPVARRGVPTKLLAAAALAAAALVVAVVALTRGGGDAFPNEAESRLLSLVPAGIRDSCTRSRDVPSNALSAVDCSAERQQVSYYRFADRAQLRREHVRRARAQLPPNLRADAGACGGPPRIGERSYLTSGRRVGRVFCGRSPGTSVIGWTDERTNVFARASRSGDDQVALYRWWATAAGPLRSTNRDSPEPPRTSVVPAGAVLYREGFSSRTSGWARPETEDARYGYSRGRYRIVVKQPNSVIPVTTANADPPLVFGSVRVEATVVRARGQRSYGFGLVCRRSQGGALYTLQVRSDSLALIRKRRAAGRPVELARPATLPRGALKRGPNRIAAVCAGGDGQPARLSLFLNGRRVVAAEDPRPLAATGAVGVLASSLSRGGVDVMFDDFRVRKA